MMFKNSMKLLCSNFDKVWKLLVFHILTLGICLGLLCIFKNYYINSLSVAWDNADLGGYFQTGTLYRASFAGALTSIANFCVIFFQQIFSNAWIGIYFCFIVFYFLPLLFNIGKYVVCEMVYGYMSAGQKQSFTGCLLKTLKSSLAYASLKVLFALVFNVLILGVMWLLTRIESTFLVYLMPFVFAIAVSLLLALKSLVLGGWAPAKITYAHSISKSYRIGVRASMRRGAMNFSTAFVIYLLAVVLSFVLGAYAIIVILPIIFPLVYIFDMVAFFSSQGMRYYVDGETIISPKKLEEVDKIEDAKFIL